MDTEFRLKSLLDPLDELSGLECDGFSRAASYVLTKAQVEHKVLRGYVVTLTCNVNPHFWLEAGVWRIDYRLRMWAGPDAPHGVFNPDAVDMKRFAEYTAQSIVEFDTPEWLYRLLIAPPRMSHACQYTNCNHCSSRNCPCKCHKKAGEAAR